MKRSTDRILTTFAGSLARPTDLLEMMRAKEHDQPYDETAYTARVQRAVAEVVSKQAETGVDIVCDGEQGKPGFFAYVSERLGGFERRDTTLPAGPWAGSREALAFPEFYQWYARGRPGNIAAPFGMVCTRPITYRGQEALQIDIANLKAALQGLHAEPEEVFMPAIPSHRRLGQVSSHGRGGTAGERTTLGLSTPGRKADHPRAVTCSWDRFAII